MKEKSKVEQGELMEANETGLAVTDQGLQLATSNSNHSSLSVVNLNDGDLPDLDDATELPLDLMSDYWSPKLPGENKKVYFDAIRMRQVQDQNNQDIIVELPCAYFFEKVKGEVKTLSNASKRLVAVLETLQRGTPVSITYEGKKRNATNAFSSDNWSVKPLILK